jgi:L,D-transpeptidase catalytic domain/Ankyrin repeats (3 copies)
MSILLFIMLFAQIEPDVASGIATFQAQQQQARDAFVSALFSNDLTLAQAALNGYFDPNDCIILSPGESTTLRSLSARAYYYYSNGRDFLPLHLAAALGETEICRLLIADGAKQFALSKGFDWIPAQFAARCGHPELAKILLGIQSSDDRFRIHVSIRSQKLIVYRDDKQFLSANISTGRNDKPTPPGNYLVTDKIRLERSTLYKVKMPYFLRLSFSEVGIHYGVNPGHPASHGCIRVGSEQLAQKIFESCPIGTLVQIE